MWRSILLIWLAALSFGCDRVHELLPQRRTTDAEMRALVARCVAKPERLAWTLYQGTFVVPTFTDDGSRLTEGEWDCLQSWTKRHRVRVEIVR